MASAAPIRSGGPLSLAVSSEHRARSRTKWGTCSAARRAIARLLLCGERRRALSRARESADRCGVALAIDRESSAPARHVPRALFSADCCSAVDDDGIHHSIPSIRRRGVPIPSAPCTQGGANLIASPPRYILAQLDRERSSSTHHMRAAARACDSGVSGASAGRWRTWVVFFRPFSLLLLSASNHGDKSAAALAMTGACGDEHTLQFVPSERVDMLGPCEHWAETYV